MLKLTVTEMHEMCMFVAQHLRRQEARGDVTEYGALALRSVNQRGLAAAVDDCDANTTVRVPASQRYILRNLSADSSQYVAVTAFTAAGCNSSLAYQPVFIQTKQQLGLQIFQFFCTNTNMTNYIIFL